MNSKTLVKALAAVFAIAGAGFGADTFAAGTATSAFAVSAEVVSACTLSSSALTFSSAINVMSATPVDANSTLTATCTNLSGYTIGLNAGTSTGATVAARKMTHTNGTTLLAYGLSAVSSVGANWEDTGGAGLATGTGDGAAQSITVYGRVPGSQTTAIVGAYSDTITATITF